MVACIYGLNSIIVTVGFGAYRRCGVPKLEIVWGFVLSVCVRARVFVCMCVCMIPLSRLYTFYSNT